MDAAARAVDAVAGREVLEAAVRHFNRGALDEAAALLDALLLDAPAQPHALHLRGLVSYRRGDFEQALARYRRALAAKGQDPVFLNHYGLALKANGQLDRAEQAFRQALAAQPGSAEAHQNLASMLLDLGRFDAAERHYRDAISSNPSAGDAHFGLARTLESVGRLDEAADAFASALRHGTALKRDAALMLGDLLMRLGRYGDARTHFDSLAATDLGPQADVALGVLDVAEGRLDEAERRFQSALAKDPVLPEALTNLSGLRVMQGQYGPADELIAKALQAHLDHAPARNVNAMRLLETGRFREGWRQYAFRFEAARKLTTYAVPMATRESFLRMLAAGDTSLLHGRTVTLVREQGLGDELFFLRFAPSLATLGARLRLVTDPRVQRLVDGIGIFAEVRTAMPALGPGDLAGYVGDLPLALEAIEGVETCPAPLALPPDEGLVRKWREGLPRSKGPWLAVTWRAGLEWDRVKFGFLPMRKQVDPESLGIACSRWRGGVVVVQRNPTTEELAAFERGLGRSALDASAANEDLTDILALMNVVDDYAGVSNTNTHLRASVQGPARVLVASPPEWRWQRAGATSPWFPGFSLYRESPRYAWGEALEALAHALASSAPPSA